MKFYNTNSFKITRSLLSLCFITSSWSSNAQISNPDVLHLSFNNQISSTGKIENLATNASNYSDSADVLGLSLSKGGACGMALKGNGARSTANKVNTNVKLDLNKSWTIAFWLDSINQGSLSYLFSSAGWNGFRCFSNGVAGFGNILLRQTNGIQLKIEGVADTAKHEIVFVHDRTNKVLKAYKDGKYHAAASYTDSLVGVIQKRDSFVIAGYSISNSLNSGALLDEFMIFSYAIDTTKLGTLSFGGVALTYNVTGCGNSAVASDGTTFNKAGTFYDTLAGSGNECDTIVTYNVKLFPSYSDTNYLQGCGSYTFEGTTYTQNTIVSNTLKSVNGCDSIIHTAITIHPISQDTQYFSGCGSYEFNGMTYNSNALLHDTLTSVFGCDSIIVTNITVHSISLDTQSINACGYYVALNGDTLRNSQMYNDTFTNINGCDSIVTMDVTIISYDPGVTRNGNDLSANQDNASYAWLDCDAGYSPITDATGQTFTPTINGNFALELTYKSCVDTSDCISVSNLSFHAFGSSSIKIQPNPNEGVFVLTSELPSLGQVRIVNANGQVVLEKEANSQSELKLDIKEFPAGIYFIEVKGQNSLDRLKVIKNN